MKDSEVQEQKNEGSGAAGAYDLHPAWRAFIHLCKELGYGEIERVKVQDGLPVLAEVARKKIKFT